MCAAGQQVLAQLNEQQFESAYSDLIVQLFELILDLESDKGDFVQVRFGLKFKLLAIDTFRRCVARINEDGASLVFWSSVAGYDGQDEEDSRRTLLPDEMRAPTAKYDRSELANEGLLHIPEPQCTAFILIHFDGCPSGRRTRTPQV